ncbi:hypothetical protein C8R42DRAFT_647434 [Lentinula raphanica]|nr:hypothetical protein C8R42DRAFT_647434 [Lentinula raphanica]
MPSQKRTSKKLKPSQTVQKKARMSSQDHPQPQAPKPPVIIRSDTESSSESSSDSESSESSSSESDSNKSSSDTLPSSNATPDEEAPLPKRKGTVRVIRPGKRRIDPMDKVGRWAVCSIDAFLNVQAIEATKLESLKNDFEPDDTDKLFLKAWDQLVAVAPALEKLLKKAHTEKGQLKYADSLNKYHTSIIHREIIDFISFDDDDPPLAKHPKSLRGINHPATLRLIIPHRYRDKVDDPEFVKKLQNGSITIRATDWPAFLYNEEQVNDNNIEDGLFTGPIILQVFYAIFFGLGSATTGEYRKNSIAARNGMRKVTGRNIAYAAVQTRFALSAVEKWNIPDGHFDYQVFYNEIVDFFEEYPEDKQSVLTLNFWNKEVFGHKDGLAGLKTVDANASNDKANADIANSTTSIARAARKARNEKSAVIEN